MIEQATLTSEDVEYVRANFRTLDELCSSSATQETSTVAQEIVAACRPGPAYTLDDGTQFFPPDYFDQITDRDEFAHRLNEAAHAAGVHPDVDEEWECYLTGIYAVCLVHVTPENIIRKVAAISAIDKILENNAPINEPTRADLKRWVDKLDQIERPFSPHYDRIAFGRPPTRDTYIRDTRARFNLTD